MALRDVVRRLGEWVRRLWRAPKRPVPSPNPSVAPVAPRHDSRERAGGTDAPEAVSVPPVAKPQNDASSEGARTAETATGGEVPNPSPPAPPKTVAEQEESPSTEPADGECPDALPDDVEATDPPRSEATPEPSKPQGHAAPPNDSRPNRTDNGPTSEPRDNGGRRRHGPQHDSHKRAGGTDASEVVSVPPVATPPSDASSGGAPTATGGEVPDPSPPAPPKTVAEQEEPTSKQPAKGESPDALPDDVEAPDPPRSEATPEPSKPQGNAEPSKDSRSNRTASGSTSEPRDIGGRRRHGPQHDSRERAGGTDAREAVSVPPAAKPPSDPSSGGARTAETATSGEVPDPSQPAPPETVAEQEEPTSKQPAKGESPDALPDDVEATDPPRSESAPEPSMPQGNAEPSKDSRPNRTASGSTREPRDIGGRRRRGPAKSGPRPQPRPQPTPPPELICRKYGPQWEVVLSATDGCQVEKVWYNGESSDMTRGEYRPPSLAGSLSVAYDGRRVELPLYEEKPLIFKLQTNWKDPGRLVDSITNGYYLVIAPADWKRTGPCSVEPSGCVDHSFLAHYFHHDKDESPNDIGGFQEYDLPLTRPQIALEGETVFDDSEAGILFGGSDPPQLRPNRDVVWAKVGEESSNGWRENFKPTEQTLAEVLDGREGRLFLRIYNKRMLDSCQFRYLRGLKEIRMNDDTYTERTVLIPSSTGHRPATVRFIGTDGAVVDPILRTGTTHAAVASGCLIVEPHPDGDVVRCTLSSESGSVDIVLHLPRIWWRLEPGASKPSDWRAKPVTLTRKKFREYADEDTVLKVRLPRRFKSVGVGFDGDLERKYRPTATEDGRCASLDIPLLDFLDHMQIDQKLHEDALLNIECGGTDLTVIRIDRDRDPMPVIASSASDPPIVKSLPGIDRDLIARVRQPHGWRCGKGFSYGEIRAAGTTVAHAKCRTMPVDQRRRSAHMANVDAIRKSLDA